LEVAKNGVDWYWIPKKNNTETIEEVNLKNTVDLNAPRMNPKSDEKKEAKVEEIKPVEKNGTKTEDKNETNTDEKKPAVKKEEK
jgi:hypothetical protein